MSNIILRFKQGNMAGLAKHLAKKYGGDPGFFGKCVACDELKEYDEEARNAICAKAHKLVTGYSPTDHRNADMANAKKAKKERRVLAFKKASDKPVGVIVIDTEENDDWMKSLPGYADEVKIHQELAKKYAADNS